MTWLILSIPVVLLIAGIVMYNSLIRLKNRVDEAESDIDVQLKRRHDLIPNLVNTVKGYAAHERELFEKITQARTQAISAGSMHEKAEAENMLTGALKNLFAVAEAYPDLKANQNFLELQRELTDTEDKIMSARRFYNGNVRDFNTKVETFPTNIFAGMMSFAKREFFEAEEGERGNVKVEF